MHNADVAAVFDEIADRHSGFTARRRLRRAALRVLKSLLRGPAMMPAMPWNLSYYPASMRHLSEPAREKAIAIANALLAEGMDEGKVIRIAIAQAKRWALRHGLRAYDAA